VYLFSYLLRLMLVISIVCPPPFKVGASRTTVVIGGNRGNFAVLSSKAVDMSSMNAINILTTFIS